MAATSKRRTYLREVNPHLVCPLCRGYLIDATTIVECLHSFCRSCILKHLGKDAHCPSCKHLLNTAKPNIKADKTLQDIVYKLVPGLYHKEMKKRREFYSKHPEHADTATPEQRGEDVSGRLIFAPEDAISLSLEYLPAGADPLVLLASDTESSSSTQKQKQPSSDDEAVNRRYLQCPALVTIAHLKKFLGLKYSVDVTRFKIDICHRRAPLPEHWTLMDVAYIFAWKRNAPIRFFYRIMKEEQRLEAPPNDRPSTPGVGASQPTSNEEANEQENEQLEKESESDSETKLEIEVETNLEPEPETKLEPEPETKHEPEPETKLECETESKLESESETKLEPEPETKLESEPESKLESESETKLDSDPETKLESEPETKLESEPETKLDPEPETKLKSEPATKLESEPETKLESEPVTKLEEPAKKQPTQESAKPESPPLTKKAAEPEKSPELLAKRTAPSSASNKPVIKSVERIKHQVKSPIKIMKNSEGRYQVLRGSSLSSERSTKPPPPPPPLTPAEFSVVSIGDGANSNGVKITLKQCPPASASRKPKVVSNILLSEGIKPFGEKPRRKVTFCEIEKKLIDVTDRKSPPRAKLEAPAPEMVQETTEKEPVPAKNVLKSSNANTESDEKSRKRQGSSTNIADRLSSTDAKTQLAGENNTSDGDKPQTPVDVYAFPNDPPAALPAGAVKRRCPPGLPIFDVRKKPYSTGKRGGGAGRGGLKCYKNQSNPTVYAKPPPSPARSPTSSTPPPLVRSSPSPKSSPAALISDDTRNLLDGCGLNIPASLSITLTGQKSPSRGSDTAAEVRKDVQHQANADNLSPTITLNDKSVDPHVLKALKTGQIPTASLKGKGRQSPAEAQPPAKRKKEDTSLPPSTSHNILDLSGAKKVECSRRTPPPLTKPKVKPQEWTQQKPLKVSSADESPGYGSSSGQVVTLSSGHMFYRAPPGSRTPAAHRLGDIPTPTRTPVYASSCFPSPGGRSPANLSSVFPSLQSYYALSQAPSLEQFHMDKRMRMSGTTAATASSPASGGQVGKSHLAAQCAPVKPARSAIGSFAVPIAKQPATPSSKTPTGKSVPSKPPAIDAESNPKSKETPAAEQKARKTDNPKQAPSKPDLEPSENIATSTEERNSTQGAASPRVTSTVSPSPPPGASEATTNVTGKSTKSQSAESDKRQPSSGSEVTSSNKSPESPDSSSVVTESVGNLVDSTKPAIEKNRDASSAKIIETKSSKEEKSSDAKSNGKVEVAEFKKPMTSEALQKRFLAALTANEWASNPLAAEQFGNFFMSLSSMQAEAQSKNAKTVE